MQTYLHDSELTYTGKELRSHFAYSKFDIVGDSIVSFIGPSDVSIKDMVDIEDVKKKSPIKSEKMLHFIVEHFDLNLEKAIIKQRLLASIMKEEIFKASGTALERRGDDLFKDDAKLSVSIATVSPVSTLIHFAVNISSKNTPVKTVGFDDLGLDAQSLSPKVMERYTDELRLIEIAKAKVKPVS